MSKVRETIADALATGWAGSPRSAALRLGLVLLALALAAIVALPRPASDETDPARSLLAVLETHHGLVVDEASVHWIDPPGTGPFNDWYVSRATVLGRAQEDGLRDLYLVRARIAPSGRVLSARPTNLTTSFNASEQAFVAVGPLLLLGTMVADGYSSLELLDFRGEDPSLTQSWPLVERLKNGITNVQQTGQWRGVHRVRYELLEPSPGIKLGVEDGEVVATLWSGQMRIVPGEAEPVLGGELASVIEPTKAVSGHVSWMVDTVRAVPMIGKDKIGWLEAKFYNLKDVFMKSFYRVAPEGYAAREIEEDMGLDGKEPYVLKLPEQMGEMDLGWPPPDVPPYVGMEKLENEGKWRAFTDERFTRRNPGHPHPLVTSFIRPDPERSYASITFVAWDPRMVEIHMQAGVVEPKSDTGKAGTGLIPRDDETMGRLLAAFNGGFQALHGEFGMMQEGKVYLPPKPWAATVARLRGGRIGFGTWPGPDVGDIPPEIVSYRQNLTPLMQDEVVNPYKRHWWGSSPDLNPDSPMIARSGICWTGDDHVIYGLAKAVNEYTFADGFRRAGCHYLIQLDVNSSHSGFEYYRVDPKVSMTETSPLDKKSEAQGEVRDRPDLLFRAKKLFKSMTLMRFPRFIQRDPRDYIYLTLARLLPGPDIEPPGGGEHVPWRVTGLPGSTTYPARFAMATLRGAEGFGEPVHVVQADPRWLRVSAAGATDGRTGAAWYPPPDLPMHAGGSTKGLLRGDHVLAFRYDELGAESQVTRGRWLEDVRPADVDFAFKVLPEQEAAAAGPLCGAFGVGPNRFLSWAETPGGDPERVFEGLKAAGAETVLAVPRSGEQTCGWAFMYTGKKDEKLIPLVSEELGDASRWWLALLIDERDPVVRLFPDTEIVKPGVWNPGQTKRIRYFRPEETQDADDKPEGDSGGEP